MTRRSVAPRANRRRAARFAFAAALPLAVAGLGPTGALAQPGEVREQPGGALAQPGAVGGQPGATMAQPGAALPAAGSRAVAYGPLAEGFAIAFRAPGATGATVTRDGRDLLISFGRAAPEFDASDLQARAAGWLEGVNVGYDALLLRLAPEVAARVEPGPAALTILLARAPASRATGDQPSPEEDAAGARRLALLDAQLLARTGRLTEARTRFESLRAASPRSPEPVAGLAGVEQQAGRWRRSQELYRDALALDPGDRSVAAALHAIDRGQASRARLDLDSRSVRGGPFTGRADLTIAQASGHVRLGEAWRAGAVVDAARIRTGPVQRASGAVESFSGWRERAELFAQHDGRDGLVTVGSLFAGSDTAGVGLQVRRPDDRGVTLLRGEYRRPNWDYVEGLIDDATRDRVAVGRVHRFGTSVLGRLEVGYNRYAIGGGDEVARTTSVSGELRLTTLAGIPGLAAAYGLEAEYVDRRGTLRAQTGGTFTPSWPLNREVHLATLGYTRTRGDRWSGGALTFDGYGGYGVDRYGRSGPLAAVAVGYAVGAIEVQLRASYVRNIGRARTTATTIGGYLSILF